MMRTKQTATSCFVALDGGGTVESNFLETISFLKRNGNDFYDVEHYFQTLAFTWHNELVRCASGHNE